MCDQIGEFSEFDAEKTRPSTQVKIIVIWNQTWLWIRPKFRKFD